jgi:hypothetical protein
MAFAAFAQSAAAQVDLAPPPLKVIPKADRERLEAKTDIKDRTKLTLELMTERLSTAERLAAAEDFDNMFRELGIFNGLIDNSLEFLNKRDNGKGKVLDNYKRLEIGLRAFMPRLETIRREVPMRYEDYVNTVMKAVRDARSKATEPMFSDSIVPARKNGFR